MPVCDYSVLYKAIQKCKDKINIWIKQGIHLFFSNHSHKLMQALFHVVAYAAIFWQIKM